MGDILINGCLSKTLDKGRRRGLPLSPLSKTFNKGRGGLSLSPLNKTFNKKFIKYFLKNIKKI